MTQRQPPTTQWDLLSKCKSLRVPRPLRRTSLSLLTHPPTRTHVRKSLFLRRRHLCTRDGISPGERRCIGTHFLPAMKRCSEVYGTFNFAREIREEKCKNIPQNINICTQRATAADDVVARMCLARCCHLKCGGRRG